MVTIAEEQKEILLTAKLAVREHLLDELKRSVELAYESANNGNMYLAALEIGKANVYAEKLNAVMYPKFVNYILSLAYRENLLERST